MNRSQTTQLDRIKSQDDLDKLGAACDDGYIEDERFVEAEDEQFEPSGPVQRL